MFWPGGVVPFEVATVCKPLPPVVRGNVKSRGGGGGLNSDRALLADHSPSRAHFSASFDKGVSLRFARVLWRELRAT